MGNRLNKFKRKKSESKCLPDLNISSPPNGVHDTTDAPQSPKPLPPIPASPGAVTMVKAMYSFVAITEDDLSFEKGDIMEVDAESLREGNDWWVAVHTVTRKKGFIPNNYVTKEDTTPQTQEWWYEIDRKEADKLLLHPGNPKGTFLIRASADQKSYALSVRTIKSDSSDYSVMHYRIRVTDNGAGFYLNAKKIFSSLFEFVSHYKENQDGLCCKLTIPCPRTRPVVAFRELEIDRSLVKLTTKLGAGCFGEVWKGTLRKVVQVAVKTLKPDGSMTTQAFLEEAKIMHKLSHPKLVQLMAVVSVNEPFWIITELMANGALLDYLRSEQGRQLVTFSTVIDFNAQIAEGMSYLESQNFVHRDLRAANVLVGDHHDVKVADFGLARILDPEGEEYIAGEAAKFPIKWTAPEAVDYRTFSVKSDVWSYGVLLYEVITLGRAPYPGASGQEVLAMVSAGKRMPKPTNGPIEVPDEYYDIMLKCWKHEAKERPTFESLMDFFSCYEVNVETSYREPAFD